MGKTPKLRFPGFTGEWEEKKLGDVANLFDYGMNTAATEFDGINKYIRITDIDEISNTYNYLNVVSPLGELDNKYKVNENDILFARTGASVGKSYLYNKSDGILYFAGFLIRINVNKNNNSKFIFLQTLRDKYNKWIKIMSMRSGQPGINANEYKSYKIYSTNVGEQEKIATFFSVLDKKIEKQQEKVELLKQYKKGMMQKIFNREIRFKDENGEDYLEWKDIQLGKILDEKIEKSTQNNQYEIISSTTNGLFFQKDYFNREIASNDNTGYKILRKHQIVLSPQNLWMGNINFNDKFDIGIVSPSYKLFEINSKFDSQYIGYILKTTRAFYEYIQASEQGASVVRRNLNIDLFQQIVFNIPCKEEQQKIANFLSTLDKKIEKEQEKLNKLNELKKGLLQQMFV